MWIPLLFYWSNSVKALEFRYLPTSFSDNIHRMILAISPNSSIIPESMLPLLKEIYYHLEQWFSVFKMQFNVVPHVIVTTKIKLFLLWLQNCNFSCCFKVSKTQGIWYATPVKESFNPQGCHHSQLENCFSRCRGELFRRRKFPVRTISRMESSCSSCFFLLGCTP